MRRLVLCLGCLALFCASGWTQGVTFNYEGRIKIDGSPYTGDGYFKFAVVDVSGEISFWSNDGISTVGDEPVTAIVASVTDGVFNVIIGDTTVPNMDALNPSMFNAGEKVFLRVWFSDTGSDFEQLLPDREITNPALLGIQTSDDIFIYVDPVNGDDRFTGLEADRPKKSIQSAWGAVPPMVGSPVTINLADGIYRECVLLTGKTMIGSATISLVGNPTNPVACRITGANEGAETTPVREPGIHIIQQNRLYIRGVLVDYFNGIGMLIEERSSVRLNGVQVKNCKKMNIFITRSDVYAVNLEASNGLDAATHGIYAAQLSTLDVRDSYFHHTAYGIGLASYSTLNVVNCVFTQNVRGISVAMGTLFFNGAKSSISYSSNVGISVDRGGSMANYPFSNVNYSNNVKDTEFLSGATYYDPGY